MSSDKMRTLMPMKIQAFVGGAASRLGHALNAVLVALGDRSGLYKTGQYRTDVPDAGQRPTAPSGERQVRVASRRDGVAE